MMKFLSNIRLALLLITSTFILSACNGITVGRDPQSIGKLYGFKKELVKGGDFWITTYSKITDRNKPFVFYIEGDGRAWITKYKISNNPTPRGQMMIKLATMDQRPNVVYVGRPCQYTPMDLNPKCSNAYWTNKRYSDDSVEAINQVINQLNGPRPFSMVGFSGGAGIAVLIAARNNNVKDIITIAGNLDHKEFTKYHNVSPMVGSLNPIDYATLINNVPQWHLSGGKDKSVPAFLGDRFVVRSNSSCVRQKIYPNNSHMSGWEKVWEYILTVPLTCYEG